MKYSKILEKYKKYFNNKLYKEQNILGVINLLNEEDLKYIKNFIYVKDYDPEIIAQLKKDKILFNKFLQLSEEKKELFYIFYKNFKFSSKKKNNIITNIKKEKKSLNEKLNQITSFFNLNLKFENLNFNINDRKSFEKNTKILTLIQKELNEFKSIIKNYINFNSLSKVEKESLNNQLKEKIRNIETYLNQIYSENIKIDYEYFHNNIFNITNEEKIINKKVIKDINNILKDINLSENIENLNKGLENYEEFIEHSKEKIIAETVKEIINQKFYLKIKKETTEITQNKINEFFKQKINIDIKNNISLQEMLKNAIEVKTMELIDKIDNPNISVKEEMKHIIKNIENINLSEIIEEIISNIEENYNKKINKNIKNEINLFLRKEIILKTFIDKYPLISMENLKNIEKMEDILNSQNRITLYEKELLKSVINDFKNIEDNRKQIVKTKSKNKVLDIIDKSLNNFIAKEHNKEVIDKIIKEINISLLDSNINIKSENEIFNEIIKKYKIDEKNINLINKIKIEIQNYIKKRDSLLLNELNDSKNINNYEIIKEEFIQNINNLINNEKIDSIYKLKKEFINNIKKNKNVSLEKLLENIALETLLNETPNIYSKIQSEFIKNNSFEFLSKEEKIEKLKIILNKEIKLLLDEKIKQKIQKNILQTMKELKPIIEKTNIYYVMNDEKILKKSKTENQFYNLLSEKVSSFFIEDSYLSNLINLNIEEPLKNVLVNKQNIFNKNEKLNIKEVLNNQKNSQIEEEIKNYITKTLFLRKRYKNINELHIVKETNNEKEVKKLIDKIYEKVISKIGNQKFIDENLIHIIKDKTLETLNDINEKKEKINLDNKVKKEIKNNITAVTKPIKRLEIEKNIFQRILNLMQNLEIARKSNNKYWEKEINNDLILILENNENLILEYAKENKILSKILKNENLTKNKIEEIIKYLKKNIQNNNETSFNKNFQIFLQLFDKNKIEKNINKIEEVINHKSYFFNEKNNFLLKNINNLLIDYYLKKENTKESKILKKLYSNYKNYNNQNIKIDEYFKNNFSLLDEESKTKFYFGDFNISYDKFIKKEENKLNEQNFQTSLKHKTKLSDYTGIYFQFLSNLNNDKIINEVIKILKQNTLSKSNDDLEQLSKIGEILKKTLIVKYNTENEFLLNIENNMLKNVKNEVVKEKIKKGFEHFLTNSINEEINNLSKMEYLTDERIDISVQNIINTIKERLTNKNLKAIKIDDELIKLSDYQNIIGDLDYEKLRKHLFFVLKNSNNLKLKYNTLKVKGVDSSKFKKELIKLKKEKILKEDLENFKKTNNEIYLENLKNYIENIIINELATNKNKIIKLKENLSYIKNKEESKNEILLKITDEIIENFIRTNKINTSEFEIDLKTILRNKILSEDDNLKNDAKNILEYYYNNENNVNNEEIQENYFNKLFNEENEKIPSNFKKLIEFYQYFKSYIEEKKGNNFQQEIYNSEKRKNEILKELLKNYLKNNEKQILLNSFSTIDFENLYSNGYTITIKNQKEILEEILNYLNLENLETEFESNLNANKILLNFQLEIKKGKNTKNIELSIKLLKEDILNNLLSYLKEDLKEEIKLSKIDSSFKYNKLLKNEIKENLKIYQEISKEKNKIYKKHEKNLIAEKYDNSNKKIINLLNKFNIDKHLINNYEIINDFEHFNKSFSILSSFDELNGIFYLFKNIDTNINNKKIEEELKTLEKADILLNNSNIEEKKIEFNFQKEYLKKERLLNINDNSFFLLKERLKDYIFLKEVKYLDEKQKLNSDEYKFLNSFQTNIDFFYFKNKKIEKVKNKEKQEELKKNNENNFLNSFLYNKELFKQIQNLNNDNNSEKQKLETKLKIIDNLIIYSFINLKFSKKENLKLKNEILSTEINIENFKQNIYNNTNISFDEKNRKLDEIFKIFSDLTKEEEYKEYFKEVNEFITLLENPNKSNKKEILKMFEKKLLENELKEKIIFLKTIFDNNKNLISEQKKQKLNKFITNITLLNFDKLNENQLEIYKIEINNHIENLIDELKLQEINISKEEIILNSIKKEREKEDIRFKNELKKEFISLLKEIKNEKFNKKIQTNLINFIQLAGNDYKFNFTVLFKKLINKQIEEIEQKIKQIKNKIEKIEEIKDLEKKLENLKDILLNTKNINETVFLKYLESINDNEFIYKNLFNTEMIENLSKDKFDKEFKNIEFEKLLNSFFSEKDVVAKKIDYVTNNVYSKKEGLYFLDIKGNSLNESSKEQYLNLNNLLLNNNIEILTWMKKNLTEKNEFYNKFNTVLEDDESTKWIIHEGQNDELNKYEKTNIYYLLENEKRIKLKKEKLNQILNEVEQQKISFELIDEETNEIKKLDIKIVDFFEINNDNDEKLNFQKFKNYIVKKIGNLSIDKEISNEVLKELENEGLTEENYEIYWNEYKNKYKYKLEEKYKNLKEKEKNGENIKEELEKIEKNIKEISKIDNLSIDFDKLYSFYEQYHKIKKEILRISNVEKKLEEKISDPTIIALIEFQILPEMIKNGYPEDIIRNMKQRIKKEKMKTDNIYRYSSIKNFKTIEAAKKKLIEEINFLEENMGQSDGITKDKYNKRLINLKKLYEEIETITMEGNVLDEDYIDKLNEKFKILLKENSIIEMHQLSRKVKKGAVEVTKETFNFANALFNSIGYQYGFGILLNEAFNAIVPKKPLNKKISNEEKISSERHQLNKRIYETIKGQETINKRQHSNFELN